MTTIGKNIVIISNSKIKVFSYQNGSLIQVIKGLYYNSDITFAYYF
jgi:hypothetical protein